MKIEDIIERASVIPVLEVADVEAAAPLATALAKGGLAVVEMTMRTPAALEALAAMKQAASSLIVGMGTIRTPGDIARATAAGADFLVSPGASPGLLQALQESGAASLPGVATASEAMTACDAGFRAMKFFPAEPAGGVAYLKALAGPLPDVVFCPTGGVSAEQAPEYLALPNVACVGGSWIASKQMIAARDWRRVEENASRAARMSGDADPGSV